MSRISHRGAVVLLAFAFAACPGGALSDPRVTFDESGRPRSYEHFYWGRLAGPCKYWNAEGGLDLARSGFYDNGKLIYPIQLVYDNEGRLRAEGFLDQGGERVGPWRAWDEHGELSGETGWYYGSGNPASPGGLGAEWLELPPLPNR